MGRLIYLLDSNILSEPARPHADAKVLGKLEQFGSHLCTAAVVVHEMRFGVARLPEGRRKASLANYLDRLLAHPIIVLPYDAEAALCHADERARQMALGYNAPYADGQIAAIAAVNGLTLVTRNVADFQRFGGLRLDNWFEP
jgi:tRNA(fMet)-specific endonuclease VapC